VVPLQPNQHSAAGNRIRHVLHSGDTPTRGLTEELCQLLFGFRFGGRFTEATPNLESSELKNHSG
jgi:hypothetical protein